MKIAVEINCSCTCVCKLLSTTWDRESKQNLLTTCLHTCYEMFDSHEKADASGGRRHFITHLTLCRVTIAHQRQYTMQITGAPLAKVKNIIVFLYNMALVQTIVESICNKAFKPSFFIKASCLPFVVFTFSFLFSIFLKLQTSCDWSKEGKVKDAFNAL